MFNSDSHSQFSVADIETEKKFYTNLSQYIEEEIGNIVNREELPILLEDICDHYDIQVEYIDLDNSPYGEKLENKTIGNLLVYNSGEEDRRYATIYIDKNSSYLLKRYALAHEISHYILERKKNKRVMQTSSLIFPGFEKLQAQEILVDYVAFILLVPEKFLKDSFREMMYNRKRGVEFDIDAELLSLSQKVQVPFYVLVSAYQFYKVKNLLDDDKE